MSRQRVFVPGFWSSMKIKRLIDRHGTPAALFYWGLNSHADDEGRGYADFDWLSLKMPILKLSDELVNNWLTTSDELDLVKLYGDKEKDKFQYYLIPDWFEKQKIPKPYPSEVPLPSIENSTSYYPYFLSLEKQMIQIIERFTREGKIINQLETSLELVRNQLETSSPMKLKEVKGSKRKRKILKDSGTQPPTGFNVFWKEYPRKVKKGEAEKAWNKLTPDDDLQKIILSQLNLFKLSQEWQEKNGKFIPYPASWINAKRWEDEHHFTEQHPPKETPEQRNNREIEAEMKRYGIGKYANK